MAKKNPKSDEEPKFVVKKRAPKEKPNFFQNIPDIKSRLNHPHPLAEVFDFPVPESDEAENLDFQNNEPQNNLDFQNESSGISKIPRTGNPNKKYLEIQSKGIGNPKNNLLDSQDSELGNPNAENLEIKMNKSGNPIPENLDSNISKDEIWISKTVEDLDSNLAAPENLEIQKKKKKEKWQGYDKKRSTAPVFIRADEQLVNEVKHFNVDRKLDMREFFELSARRFMDSFGNPKESGLDSNIALDDRRMMIMFKTKSSIINLFRAYNRILTPNSEWKPKDDVVGAKYNEIDLRIVEIGIITTQTNILENNSDTQVSRFKYYTREIDKMAAIGFTPETLAVMIVTYRKRWAELTEKELDLSFLDAEEKS